MVMGGAIFYQRTDLLNTHFGKGKKNEIIYEMLLQWYTVISRLSMHFEHDPLVHT